MVDKRIANALKKCLFVKKNDKVLIVTDTNKIMLARKFEKAAKSLSNHVSLISMKPINIYKNLKSMLQSILIIGEVTEGMHEGGYYVAIKGYYDQFKNKLGFEPYKGTLNLKLTDTDNEMLREKLNNIKPVIIEGFKDQNREYGPVKCYDVYISRLDNKNNFKQAAILDIQRTHHQKNIIEILAKPYLRDCFNLKDGDKLVLNFNHP